MIRTIMKIFAAAALCAPATVEAKKPKKNGGGNARIGVVSWNTHGEHGDYGKFFKSKDVNQSSIIMLQERSGKKLGVAKNFGWDSTKNLSGGLATLWDRKKFSLVPNSNRCDTLPGGKNKPGLKVKQRDGTTCTILLKGRKGGFVMVTNVHAGHNGSPRQLQTGSALQAHKALLAHQNKYVKNHPQAKKALHVLGGDHNEMGLVLKKTKKSSLRGQTKHMGKWGKTHGNGKIDLMFANKSGMGKGKILSNFGSDHKAVRIIV